MASNRIEVGSQFETSDKAELGNQAQDKDSPATGRFGRPSIE